MAKRILVTGAATGFGRGTALALSKRGHTVIAGVQIAPQVTELMKIAGEAGTQMKIQVLDITDEGDRQAAFKNEVDVPPAPRSVAPPGRRSHMLSRSVTATGFPDRAGWYGLLRSDLACVRRSSSSKWTR